MKYYLKTDHDITEKIHTEQKARQNKTIQAFAGAVAAAAPQNKKGFRFLSQEQRLSISPGPTQTIFRSNMMHFRSKMEHVLV